MEPNGWICLHRKFTQWEWWDDHNVVRLFLYMLLEANHEDKKWQGVAIPRGSFVSSTQKLAKATRLSGQNIKTAISKLQRTGELTCKPTSKFTMYTIANYSAYQDKPDKANQRPNQRPTSVLTSDQPASNQQVTTNNNDNNDNKIETYKGEENSTKVFIEPPSGLSTLFERVCKGFSTVLVTWLNDCGYQPEWIKYALMQAEERQIKKPIPYCKKILEGIKADGGLKEDVGNESQRCAQGNRDNGRKGTTEPKPGYEPGKFADWD